MMSSNRTVYAVITVVALALVVVMLLLINTSRLTDEDFSATVDARVADALTQQGIQPTAAAVQTQAAQDFEATSQANIAAALTQQGIQPTAAAVQTRAAQNEATSQANIAATELQINETIAAQPASVLTQVAELYPSATPTDTATA